MIINFDQKQLSAETILSQISEQAIYEYYLNEPIKANKLVRCCFHEDKSPSLSFYMTSKGNLMYKCFGCGVQGNVFSFV